jgi:hypothetical protein
MEFNLLNIGFFCLTIFAVVVGLLINFPKKYLPENLTPFLIYGKSVDKGKPSQWNITDVPKR